MSRPSLLGKVFAKPEHPDNGERKLASELGVATISAAMGEPHGRNRLLAHGQVHRASGHGVVAGRAVTVWSPAGNNTMLRYGIESSGPGDVLVVTTPADAAAQWGDLATEWAKARGAEGALVDGAVRDVADMRAVGFSVWARTIDPRQAMKQALGYVNAPIAVGGLRIEPGDLVVADDDAVLVLAADEVDEALRAAQARADKEALIRADCKSGRMSPHLAAIFDAEGVELIDRPWQRGDPDGTRP